MKKSMTIIIITTLKSTFILIPIFLLATYIPIFLFPYPYNYYLSLEFYLTFDSILCVLFINFLLSALLEFTKNKK